MDRLLYLRKIAEKKEHLRCISGNFLLEMRVVCQVLCLTGDPRPKLQREG